MKTSKIFPQDWKNRHPYKDSDATDAYYTKIANRVMVALKHMQFDTVLDGDASKYVALALTSWFEDVISEIGIWKIFTTECKRRYGSYLPFYDTSEGEYFPEEINLDDVRFLLWHYVQQDGLDRSLINPENRGIEATAEAVYEIFDQEYEVAPENNTLRRFFENLDVSTKSFYPLRNTMEWFCFDCYLNFGNVQRLADITMDFIGEQDPIDCTPQYINAMTYNLRVDHILSTRSLLAWRSYQWLAKIIPDAAKRALLSEIIYKRYVGIYVDSADDEFVYAREMGADGQPIKITVESFDPKNLKHYLGKSALVSLLYFDGVWWVSGGMMKVDSAKLEEKAAEEANQRSMIKRAYDLYVETMGGNPILFFENTAEYEEFARKRLGMQGDGNSLYPNEVKGRDLFICGNPEGGIYTQFDLCDCLKHRDNKLYNKAEAKEYAHGILLDREIPYFVATKMIDEGLLSDAKMVSEKGDKHGHALMQRNIHFLNDYFREGCRELDYAK